MPISTRAHGARLGTSEVEITARRILAYAAGIGDTADPVFDDASDQLVAPPQICVSLEWPVVSHPSLREKLGALPEELRRGVHAVQDSLFHRPIRPGDRLITSGRWIGLHQTKAGAMLITRLSTVEADSGRPVVTTWSSSIYRGVPLGDGSAQSLVTEDEGPPPLPELALDPDRTEIQEIFIPREMPHTYTECADIWNPIHTERSVALAAGLPDIILHGTATWALAGREIVRRNAGGNPHRLRRLHGQFRAMVIPGTTSTVEHTEAPAGKDLSHDQSGVAFVVKNEQGQEAVRKGVAILDPA